VKTYIPEKNNSLEARVKLQHYDTIVM